MARSIPFLHRRIAEESVRRGMAAPVVMEAAAREWAAGEGDEEFPRYLVRREVLRGEQVEELAEAVRGEEEAVAPAEGAAEASAPPRAPHPSEVIRGYRILERLGRGGMGSVYRAEQSGMNRVVALKILRRPLGEAPEHVERLKREARLVGSLDHPHIVRGLDVGQHGPYHYFAMEFVEGETLRDLLKRRGVLPESEALRLLEQITLALDHAHSRAVVHRDVKPGNIIVTPDGTPKLTDYGLAKGPSDFALTQSGVTIGTPQYLSPEQAREPARVDIQTDLYSLGATAYHMLAGIPPHTSETLAGLLTKVLYEKPRTVRQVNLRVSAGASFLVEKLMAKQKRHRYRTPKEVLRDLRALAAGKSIVPRDWAGDFEVQEVRRRFRIAVGTGASVVAALAAGVVWLQHRFEVQQVELREANARTALDEILNRPRPRDHAGWLDRGEELDMFLRHPEHERTTSSAAARAERGVVDDYARKWVDAEGYLHEARVKADEQGDFRGACEALDGAAPEFQRAGAVGRAPYGALQDDRDRWALRGLEEAGREAGKALAEAEAVEPAPDAARRVEGILAAARERIVLLMVLSETQEPVQALDRVLGAIRGARAVLEDTLFPASARAEVDEAERRNQYAPAYDLLSRAQQGIETEPSLLHNLQGIPAPAAFDLRGVVSRRLERVREHNRAWLKDVLGAAEVKAGRAEYDGALALLDSARELSLPEPELTALLQSLAASIAADKERKEEGARKAVAALFEGFLDDLTRRDYAAAGRRLKEAESAQGPGVPNRRLTRAIAAAQDLLQRIEAVVFDPIRRQVREGKDFRAGFLFQGPKEIRRLQVSNVALRETPTGEVLVFDSPGEKGLQRALHRLSLDLLFVYVPLPEEGLSLEQALVRGALLIADVDRRGERDPGLRELEDARSHVQRAKDGLPGIEPVADALLARAEELRTASLGRQKDLEKEAEETYGKVEDALSGSNPREALRLIDLLLGPLLGTEVVKNRRPQILEKQGAARRMMLELRVKALFKHAEVTEVASADPGRGSHTRVRWPFAGEGDLQDFVPPEDNGAPLYAFVPEEGGRLAFRGPEPGAAPDAPRRWPSDTPVTVECPFQKSRTIAVSFTYRSEGPLYLQVSILTCHMGMMTDDGKRESGRGVYAWQSPDWRDADRWIPAEYRHDYVARQDLQKVKDRRGQRYFQLEPGTTYEIRVVWDNGHLRLLVDGQEKWDAQLPNQYPTMKDPRIRILAYTPGWIDDLTVEGELDTKVLDGLLRGR